MEAETETFDEQSHLDNAIKTATAVHDQAEAEEMGLDTGDDAEQPKPKAKPKAKAKADKPTPGANHALEPDDADFAKDFEARRADEEKREAAAQRKREQRAKAKQQADKQAAQPKPGDAEGEGDDTEEPEDTSPIDRKVARARFKQDPHAAITETFGKEALAALKVDPKAFHALREGRRKLDQQAQAHRAELEQVVGRVRAEREQVKSLAEAKQAYDAGDYQKAHKLAFGEDINEFQKRALRQRAGEDPRVSKLERELQQREQREREWHQRQQTEQAKQRQARARQQLQADITGELEAIEEDARVPLAAKRPEFVQAVIAELKKSYDPHTQTTIGTDEAAAIVLHRFADANRRWAEILDRAEQLEDISDRAVPAKRRRRVSLSQSGASDAATPADSQLSEDEIIAKHVRLMKQAQLSERVA